MNEKIFLLVLISFFLLPFVFGAQVNASMVAFSEVVLVEENYSTVREAIDAASSGSIEVDETVAVSFQGNSSGIIQGEQQMLQFSSGSNSVWISRHLMCKDHDPDYNPIDPTTIFRPDDIKAVCLTTISTNDTSSNGHKIEFRWHYRSNSSKTWVSCHNWSGFFFVGGIYQEYRCQCNFSIAGYWPGYHYPRAYKVDVHLDDSYSPSFSEFFEVTDGGLNSSCMCEDVDVNASAPVNMKSRFTIGVDTKAHHYLRFDKIAYFNEELNCCHSFTTVWIQPNGNTYKTYSGNFTDYKNTNFTWNYWEHRYILDDYISINSSTPIGNWTVEVYLDRYFNNTWMHYGPIASTPFIVGIANWTFMVYLDADNNLETPAIEIFLKMASVGSSSQVNTIVQMDRTPDYDSRYGNWTDCYRFRVTEGMTPTPGNATRHLGEVNMGHPDTLKDFVNWTINNYPANYYFLVLWDHGAGCIGVCIDETSDNDFLTLPELSQALNGLPAIMDVVLLDACSMSMTEIAYQIKDYANVLVGPEGIGYAMVDSRPAPYYDYLSTLTSNSSMLPNAFAKEVVTHYMNWCNSEFYIQNATMSATDLTKITSLMTAIDDFALKLKEKETLYHEQISSARNSTAGYQGPAPGRYYIDLYHFAQLIDQHVIDEELRNTADQVMTTLESIIIIEANKDRPNSHGLSIYFPDEEDKYYYSNFETLYEETTFAEDTLWDEFVKYHLHIQTSGYVLTIQTPYPGIQVEFDEESYTTDAEGKLRVFVLPDSYNVSVPTPVYNVTGPGSRGVFTEWDDHKTNPSRTITLPGPTTYTAYYETQFEVTFSQSGVGTDFTETIVIIDKAEYNVTDLPISFWWNNSITHTFAFQSPLVVTTNTKQYVWDSTDDLSSLRSGSIDVSMSGSVIGNYKTQYYLTMSTNFGTINPRSGWHDAGSTVHATLDTETVNGTTGTRYVFTQWSDDASGTNYAQSDSIIMDAPKIATANWKTQYYLTIDTDPTGLSSQPNISIAGPWYDDGTQVTLTAETIEGYTFNHWDINETAQDPDANPISLTMDGPCKATAHYVQALAWWEALFRPEKLHIILGLVGIGFSVTLVGAALIITRRRRGIIKVPAEPVPIEVTEVLPDRIPTGSAALDNLLFGGIPENYAVILTSHSCDERDLLIKEFLETGAKKGEVTFYVTTDSGEAKSLVEEFQSNFYLFICNPQADKIIKSLPNVFKIRGVENLTDLSIALTKAFRRIDESITGPRRACIEIISDVLLQHHAVQTRRWLTDVITELKSRGFTTLAVVNPKMHPSEEVHAILDLFEGEINIYERAREENFLKIKKMYKQRYLDSELPLKKEKLEKK